MSSLRFCALIMVGPLLSMEGQKALGFHQKYLKGAIDDWNIFCYAGWKSHHIPIAIIKLSGLNVCICIYIFCGRRRTKRCSSNQNVQSEHYERLSYLPVNTCICIPLRTLFTVKKKERKMDDAPSLTSIEEKWSCHCPNRVRPYCTDLGPESAQ